MIIVHGTLRCPRSLADLGVELAVAGLEVTTRDSAHYTGGSYLKVELAGVHATLERISDGEYLCRADGESLAQVSAGCRRLSGTLARLGIAHRFELYGDDDILLEDFGTD